MDDLSLRHLPSLYGSSDQKLQASKKRSSPEIGVRRKAVPYYNFFLKNIYKAVQFYKTYRHTSCFSADNWKKKIIWNKAKKICYV